MSALAKAHGDADAFHLWQPYGDVWQVRGPRDCCGGLFADIEAASRFIRKEAETRGLANCVLCFPPPVSRGRTAARFSVVANGPSGTPRRLNAAAPILRSIETAAAKP